MISVTKPVIGITCGEIYNKKEPWWPVVVGQSQTYVQSVIDAGGIPLLLPLTDDEALLQQLIAMIDGLYLAGGNDLHPARYGQKPDSTTVDFSILRDSTEQILLTMALETRKPILGICRGMQLLNVHFGGDLIQDIPSTRPDALDHDASSKMKTLIDTSHMLHIEAQSLLAGIVGTEQLGTNAHHHQAVDKLGEGIVAVAWASDGIVEAIELKEYPFAIGIQAHPESLTKTEPRWQKLFDAFIDACRQH